MRICLDVRYTTRSGASTFIEGFLANLPQACHDHTIGLVAHRDKIKEPERSQVSVPFRNRLLEFQWSQTMLPRHLKHGGYDIYHSLKHVGPIRCPVKSVYRVPAVGQFVGQYPQRLADQVYWNHAAGRAYRRADLLIAVSEYIRHGLIQFLGYPEDRVVTVYNGVDGRFGPAPVDASGREQLLRLGIDRPFLLCVANIVAVKNQEVVIRALARLPGRDVQLVFAGNDRTTHAKHLKELVSALGLDGQVCFLGPQNLHELKLFYNSAEMLVHPSFHEGLSSTLLESMACGLPIVAARTTSIPETTGDAALYHEPRDAAQLAERIGKLLHDSELRQTLSTRALHRSRQFSWARCVQQTLAAYNRLN